MKWHSLRMGALAALVVATIGPTPGMAQQQFSWDSYCTVGSLQFCASVDLSMIPNSDGTQTSVAIRIRNLEGTVGSTPFMMEALGFYNLGSNSNGGPSLWAPPASLSGTAGIFVPDPTRCELIQGYPCVPGTGWGQTYWYFSGPYSYASPPPPHLYMEIQGSDPSEESGTIGCDMPSTGFAPEMAFFQTCGEGWVGIAFTLPDTWFVDNASYMTWLGVSDNGTVECTVGRSGASSSCVQVTPEPVTMVLLATGLFGIGAVRRRRRLHDNV